MGFSDSKKSYTFLKAIAWIFSFLFHPILLPTWLFIVIMYADPMLLHPINPEGRSNLIFVILISTFVLPLLMIFTFFLLRKREFKITDLVLNAREERILPFVFTAVYYFALTYTLFWQFGGVLLAIMLSVSVISFVIAAITTFWKISAHSVSMGGFFGILIALAYHFPANNLLVSAMFVALIGGMVLTARLFLKSHTLSQVYFGYVVGLIIGVISVILNS